MPEIYVTLNQIRKFSPCKSGWEKLLAGLGKTSADDQPVPMSFIITNNGIEDAIWCMRVNWFEHKQLYMSVINKAAARSAVIAATAYSAARSAHAVAAVAYSAAHAVAAAAAAHADAAAAAAHADAAYAAERDRQARDFLIALSGG